MKFSEPALDPVPARVVRAWDETTSLRGLALEGGERLTAAHVAPGQYVKVEIASDVEGFFALANAPGRELEVLVKRGGDAADALVALGPGDRIRISAPHGPGYPIARHAGRDLLLFAAGTGIAPIRSVVQCVIGDRRRYGAVHVWHGQRGADEFAYEREHDAWAAAEVGVVKVLSGDDPAWTGERGWVQDVLRRDPPVGVERAVAYVCGMKGMEDAVAETLAGMGMDRRDVHRNY